MSAQGSILEEYQAKERNLKNEVEEKGLLISVLQQESDHLVE